MQLKLVDMIIPVPPELFDLLRALQLMNDPMAIPADRLQVVHPVRSTVRTIFSIVWLQPSAGFAACTTPTGSLHHHPAMQLVLP